MQVLYQNNHIRIRPYRSDDKAGMCECVQSSIAQMQPYLPWVHENFAEIDCENWIRWAELNWRSGRQYDFVIEEKDTGVFLGGVGLLEVDLLAKTAKLGYWLRTEYTGKGLTTQAAKLISNFARQQLGLEKLTIYMSTDNKASIAIAKKLGASYQMTKKKCEHVNGRDLDCEFYCLDLTSIAIPAIIFK